MSLDTTPSDPELNDDEIEAAAKDLPSVLSDLRWNNRYVNPKPALSQCRAIAADLADALAQRKGHSKAAAKHAIHRLIGKELLSAEIADRGNREIVLGGLSEILRPAIQALGAPHCDP